MNKDIMKTMGFGDEVASIEQDKCPFCKEPINEDLFKDELSRKEFRISGLCQECQDKTFGGD